MGCAADGRLGSIPHLLFGITYLMCACISQVKSGWGTCFSPAAQQSLADDMISHTLTLIHTIHIHTPLLIQRCRQRTHLRLPG